MAATVSWGSCLFVHLLIFGWYVFTLWANCTVISTERHPGAKTYGGRWKYLTFINLVMHTVFFGLCVFIDIVHLVLSAKALRGGLPSLLVKLRDITFTVLAFPVGTFVFSSFWSIYAYDRELVYPKFLDDIIPVWLNHALHTIIVPLLFVQMYIQNHQYVSKVKGVLGLAIFALLYLSWVLWVHHVSDIWVYPIMAKLSPVGLVLFFGAAALTMAPLYLLGEKISRKIWGNAGPQKKKKK
ncbi:androgen-dependent TFPI-regulating protein-like [Lampris incognitus]|uniref:androgen-dependent TFPI-regulating protein-like n=1 Tax=Lampris incognitus TaxID=2546036 RepID=UPI0024B48B54|nr:androgen-dependent TFPI-regulating protein-like [Lampris incognitus]